MTTPILDEGGPNDPQSLCLVTARGRRIRNVPRGAMDPKLVGRAVERYAQEHPGARLRSLSPEYNCVGMVFASRRTTVDVDQLPLILEDDGYRPVSEPGEVCPGDIALYGRDADEFAHIALVLSLDPKLEVPGRDRCVTVLSKWGPFGEYIHLVDDVPLTLRGRVEYWTERTI